ncbi:MAG: type II toxin-antitoxin system HicA family toxin [bacterium]|nr:type II toxin-antitoxin system HicA family toxin [bacterium]MDE0417332.1 type II toxin-antitoxin system HicA family toxin [bacterium]
MPSVPVLKPREVMAVLAKLEFMEIRQRDSHKRFRHPDGRMTTVPVHGGRDASPVLLRCIARDVGLTVREFVAHRRWIACHFAAKAIAAIG